MAVSSMVETGVSFTSAGGVWNKHNIALDFETVAGRLDGPAREKWDELSLTAQIKVIRAIEELLLYQFRKTRNDPDLREGEDVLWRRVLERLVGDEGLERVGV
jgi:hypothetical protein